MEPLFVVKDAEAKIMRAVRLLVNQFHPEKIILFGSRARGDARPDSDADLLVVTKLRGSRHRLATKMRVCVSGIGISKDIVLVTPREFRLYKNVPGTIVYPALREGKVLYEIAA